MGSTRRRLKNFPPRKLLRGSTASQHRRCRSRHKKSTTVTTSSSVSEKLVALKNLIPAQEVAGAGTSSADQLFQETADYILLLRTQVSVLQKLVEFYGNSSSSSSSSPSLVQQ